MRHRCSSGRAAATDLSDGRVAMVRKLANCVRHRSGTWRAPRMFLGLECFLGCCFGLEAEYRLKQAGMHRRELRAVSSNFENQTGFQGRERMLVIPGWSQRV